LVVTSAVSSADSVDSRAQWQDSDEVRLGSGEEAAVEPRPRNRRPTPPPPSNPGAGGWTGEAKRDASARTELPSLLKGRPKG